MTHVTSRLTAKNRDQLRNPTIGNRVWATITFKVFNTYFDISSNWSRSTPRYVYFRKVRFFFFSNASCISADSVSAWKHSSHLAFQSKRYGICRSGATLKSRCNRLDIAKIFFQQQNVEMQRHINISLLFFSFFYWKYFSNRNYKHQKMTEITAGNLR